MIRMIRIIRMSDSVRPEHVLRTETMMVVLIAVRSVRSAVGTAECSGVHSLGIESRDNETLCSSFSSRLESF